MKQKSIYLSAKVIAVSVLSFVSFTALTVALLFSVTYSFHFWALLIAWVAITAAFLIGSAKQPQNNQGHSQQPIGAKWHLDPNHLRTGILQTDASGKVLNFNTSFIDIMGDTKAPTSVKDAFEPLHALLLDRSHADEIIDAVSTSADLQYTDTLKLLDQRTFERITRPVPGDERHGHERLWIIRDVTHLYRDSSESALHQSLIEEDAARTAELAEQLFHAKAELESKQAELTRLANIDALTGLLNRRRFLDLSNQVLHGTEANGKQKAVWVIMLDIDHFKRINDTHGHSAGDTAIRDFARIIETIVADSGYIGRLGGEEFAISLVDCDQNKAFQVAEDIRKQTAHQQTTVETIQFRFTCSAGVAKWEKEEATIEAALDRADKALYSAKDFGRNRVVGYEQA